MTSTTRRLAVVAGAATLASLGVAMSPAQACACSDERIVAHVSDTTPDSGETFRVHGRWTRVGQPVVGHTVKVQTRRDGAWEDITGARVSTSTEGRYAVRVVLSQTGERTMRVVGINPGPAKNFKDRFVVTVG